jgi:hypothetical protein
VGVSEYDWRMLRFVHSLGLNSFSVFRPALLLGLPLRITRSPTRPPATSPGDSLASRTTRIGTRSSCSSQACQTDSAQRRSLACSLGNGVRGQPASTATPLVPTFRSRHFEEDIARPRVVRGVRCYSACRSSLKSVRCRAAVRACVCVGSFALINTRQRATRLDSAEMRKLV